MRVILQRVSRAQVCVDGDLVGAINHGLVALVGFGNEDSTESLAAVAKKIVTMRIFSNDTGRFDRSVLDVHGGILAVPQFTLYADTTKGRRPEFFNALRPDLAEPLFDQFVAILRSRRVAHVGVGRFGAHMHVELVNDGPVTIALGY